MGTLKDNNRRNDSNSGNDFPDDVDIDFLGDAKPVERPGSGDEPYIYIEPSVHKDINKHAQSDTSRELGGVLLGEYIHHPQSGKSFINISASIIARDTKGSGTHITFTQETYNEINRKRDKNYPGLHIVGWYHTHPRLGVFLSGHDTFIQEHYFNKEWQVAYVIDPVSHKEGFFRLKNNNIVECKRIQKAFPLDHAEPGTGITPIDEKEHVHEKIIKFDDKEIQKVITDTFQKAAAQYPPPGPTKRRAFRDIIVIGLMVLLVILFLFIKPTSTPGTDNQKLQQVITQEIKYLSSNINDQFQKEFKNLEQTITQGTAGDTTPPAAKTIYVYKHIVREGETLSGICRKYYKDGTVNMCERAAKYNNISLLDPIIVGQTLLFPPVEMLMEEK